MPLLQYDFQIVSSMRSYYYNKMKNISDLLLESKNNWLSNKDKIYQIDFVKFKHLKDLNQSLHLNSLVKIYIYPILEKFMKVDFLMKFNGITFQQKWDFFNIRLNLKEIIVIVRVILDLQL